MRTLFGIILGAAITIGGAYLYDSHNALAGTPKEQAMVNWDIVGQKWDVFTTKAKVQFDRLSDRAKAQWNRHVG
ncbi:MAG: hypothetical protein JO205_05090 [Pseudolabrys sp.]|nr:hypothetical protein [Pseudolabrys sp.]MBV9260726.1 hypothetical protein [Pseudolabrys sp.]